MAKKKKGFFDGLIEDIIYHGMVEAARDPVTGKVDPYAAAGIAFGSGKMKTFGDQMRLAAHLGAAGAFDPDSDSGVSSSSSSNDDWRIFCEDGSEYDVDPDDYFSEDEYNEALEEAKHAWRDNCEDGSEYGVDPEDYETEDEYNEALEASRYAWRDNCEDGSDYDIDPEDYETEDEYTEALENAKYAWRDFCQDPSDVSVDPNEYETEEEFNEAVAAARIVASNSNNSITAPVGITFKLQFRGQEALDAIQESDYPNKRQYDAAYRLCDVKQDTAYISDDSSKEAEIEKCEFILSGNCIAARYLTVYDGFLYAQAVKDHFALPVELPDEDKEPITYFDDMFLEIAEYNVDLAVNIWRWCIKEFGPYKRYMQSEDTLYNSIFFSTDDYPDSFMDAAIKAICGDEGFRNELLLGNPSFPYGIDDYIAHALLHGQVIEAKVMFETALSNNRAKGKDREEFIDSIISSCSNWDELETMESFKFHLLPFVYQLDDRRIQRLLPKITKAVDEYIQEVEASEVKYQYSRRFSWRKTCIDGSEYGIDPLDYETEAEYLAAIESEKYEWRSWYTSEAKEHGLSLTDYETEELFLAAVEAAESGFELEEARKPDDALTNAEEVIIEALGDAALISEEDSPILSVDPALPSAKWKDPLEETDKTVYTFCGVTFPHGDTIYHYLTNDDTLSIGDLVVVPAGFSKNEVICEIATIEKHRRKTAPYPVDRAKYIIGRHVDDNPEVSVTSSNGNISFAQEKHSDPNAFATSDGITDMLLAKGLRYEDNRSKGGKVWIYDSPDAEMVIRQVETRFGVKFIYAEHGGKVTNGKPAWYMK